MLRNVQFNYPHTSVTDVTQNNFHNYFGGSEIVVAGKFDPAKLDQLESIITATSVLPLICLFCLLIGPLDTVPLERQLCLPEIMGVEQKQSVMEKTGEYLCHLPHYSTNPYPFTQAQSQAQKCISFLSRLCLPFLFYSPSFAAGTKHVN